MLELKRKINKRGAETYYYFSCRQLRWFPMKKEEAMKLLIEEKAIMISSDYQ